ncbi:aminotransferase-like domain-containing protein [Lysobacter solisilvae (ex Woo and Kim 2020)]|uniref:PLP-dependent aminotransferase family protein n=1 Tax=Agrilutibacter terrestris TaxID=2865112 RepID=A0A7H0FWL9_9GAMM|nr:PLP-dependent aminotransferase family protein [Lysobacter terrestris]QNP40435.1 PLP-dependent aminotransferase family protein [Lysobacter terrestris]
MKRYEALADDVARSIRAGLLRPGARLPSVRQASAARKLSPATIFQAYYLLEAQGLIESRARSGYYVTQAALALPPEPETASRPDGESREVDVSELVFEVLQSAMQRDIVPLGSAFMSPAAFPLDRIGRAVATAALHLDPWSTVDDLTPGNAALRRQIALRYLIDGMDISADEIVVTNGALEALNLCIAAVTQPGDAVVVESPCFYACLQSLERNGLRAIEVPTHPRDGIDLDALETAIARHAPRACWLMPTFHNPLGCTMPEERKRALVELLARHGIPLVEDDVYADLHYGPRRALPAKAFDREGLVMHCSSFSKSLAPGYRIGWVAAGRRAQDIARRKLTSTLNTNVPMQIALARYLERGGFDRHLRRLRSTLAQQQASYAAAIAAAFPPGTRVTRPAGGYFLWLELPEGVDALQLQRRASKLGISIAPGPMFSASRGFGNCLRLNCGHPLDARIAAALRELGTLAASTA